MVWWGAEEPFVRRLGAWAAPSDLLPDIERNRADLAARGKPNEVQALVADPMDLALARPTIGYRLIDYATARAIRGRGPSPGLGVLSASSFLVEIESETLLIQKRGATMDLNPHRIHGFAGAYHPGRSADDSDGDGLSLLATARRELHEETGLDLADMKPAHLVLFSDPNTTAIELCLLGIAATAREVAKLHDTGEGGIFRVPMAELGDLLRHNDRWGPGGQCEVMAWLALGAPPFPPDKTFGGRTARTIFEDLTAV